MDKYCRNCGAELPEKASYCPQCGSIIPIEIPAPPGAVVIISDAPPEGLVLPEDKPKKK